MAYVRYLDDFAAFGLSNNWEVDIGGIQESIRSEDIRRPDSHDRCGPLHAEFMTTDPERPGSRSLPAAPGQRRTLRSNGVVVLISVRYVARRVWRWHVNGFSVLGFRTIDLIEPRMRDGFMYKTVPLHYA